MGNELLPIEVIQHRILVLRGCKVLIDKDLASLYGVNTKALNQAVKRNADRFPTDFMFQLTEEERAKVVTNCDHLAGLRFSPALPFAFTEHGALMAANVLRSHQAVRMSVFVVRAFVHLRALLAPYKEIMVRLDELEKTVTGHDELLRNVISTVRSLIEPPPQQKQPIGFHIRERRATYQTRTKNSTV